MQGGINLAKRGRKPSEKIKGYFLEEQEEAVLEYLACESKEGKEKIYNEKLRAPFDKMVESIIRRYKLYIPDETSGETFTDTISFLLTKMDKFKPGNKTKAFSYYGTICKNHLIGRIETYAKGLHKIRKLQFVSSVFSGKKCRYRIFTSHTGAYHYHSCNGAKSDIGRSL